MAVKKEMAGQGPRGTKSATRLTAYILYVWLALSDCRNRTKYPHHCRFYKPQTSHNNTGESEVNAGLGRILFAAFKHFGPLPHLNNVRESRRETVKANL